jgi:hypothetical protein
MVELFDSIRELRQDVIRNIPNVLSSREAFSDLLDNAIDAGTIADKAMARVADSQFHYTAAIGYPFETDYFMKSRYSDGTFPIWYGSLEPITAMKETAYHMFRAEMAIDQIEQVDVIVRKRIVYKVYCAGILIDLSKKFFTFPKLVENDYQYTQNIGKKLREQGFPGLLAPSARYRQGVNVSVFQQEILNNPRVDHELIYQLFPAKKTLSIHRNKRQIEEIRY